MAWVAHRELPGTYGYLIQSWAPSTLLFPIQLLWPMLVSLHLRPTQIVVAVVVPVGSVLLAALVGSIWWARRNRRRELEQRQRVKAAADKAADLEAGDPREKTGSGGGRLGVLAGGLRRSGDGDVFLGVEGEHGLPQWSEAAHLEAVRRGDMYSNLLALRSRVYLTCVLSPLAACCPGPWHLGM